MALAQKALEMLELTDNGDCKALKSFVVKPKMLLGNILKDTIGAMSMQY